MFTKTSNFCLFLDIVLVLLLFGVVWFGLAGFAMRRFRKRWELKEETKKGTS